jgi:hypothetical protein
MAHISRGNTRYHLRDPAGLHHYLTVFEIDPQAAAAEVLRILAADLRQEARAVLENCRKHLRICPGDVVARVRQGLTRLLLGEEAAALRDLGDCLRQAPEVRKPLELLVEQARAHRGASGNLVKRQGTFFRPLPARPAGEAVGRLTGAGAPRSTPAGSPGR